MSTFSSKYQSEAPSHLAAPCPPTAHEIEMAVKASGDPLVINQGAPDLVSVYTKQGNFIVTAVLRWNPVGSDKIVRPCTPFKASDGSILWLLKGPPHGVLTNPLGWERIADNKPIIIVEGEQKRERLQASLGDWAIVLTWRGGANNGKNTDWSDLAGRMILIWPDNDDSGKQAMYDVAAAAKKAGAVGFKTIDLSLLAAELGVKELAKGFDADDLLRDWTGDRLRAFLDRDGVIVPIDESKIEKAASKPTRSPKGASTNGTGSNVSLQVELETMINDLLAAKKLTVDAIGRWRENGTTPIRMSTLALAKDLTREIRLQGVESFKCSRVFETLESQVREWKAKREAEILAQILRLPADPKGVDELRRWIIAVTGSCDDIILAAVMHWVWLVKRSLAGLDRRNDMMLVVFSAVQGIGKTEAVKRLCSPLSELSFDASADHLTDDRFRAILSDCAIGVWDEMGGATKAETDKLKHTLSVADTNYRQLGTHEQVAIYRRANFIATSNKPVSDLIRDTTGNRRFVEVNAKSSRFDWEEINRLDYGLIWRCVNEDDAEPILPFLDKLKLYQATSRHLDSVALWLEEETWTAISLTSPGGMTTNVGAYVYSVGESSLDLRTRYLRWCVLHGERQPLSDNLFFSRLRECGFITKQMGQDRKRRYFRPDPPPALSSIALP